MGFIVAVKNSILDDGIKIIPMQKNHLPAIANIHFEAFRGYMNTKLGNAYINAFYYWFLNQMATITLVAVDSRDAPKGYVVGAPLGYAQNMNRDLFWVGARGIIMRPWLLASKKFRHTIINRVQLAVGRTESTQLPSLPDPILSLVAIGVHDNAKNQGIGKKLMVSFEIEANKLGFRSMRLSVYPDNNAARYLYERCGWQSVSMPPNKTGSMYYTKIL